MVIPSGQSLSSGQDATGGWSRTHCEAQGFSGLGRCGKVMAKAIGK